MVNVNVPASSTDYIHRVGRTARAGKLSIENTPHDQGYIAAWDLHVIGMGFACIDLHVVGVGFACGWHVVAMGFACGSHGICM